MAYKVVIDAGHGGTDPGAVYKGRQEKDDNLRLALAVGRILSQNGVDVVYTRTTDVYQTPFEKARIANQTGADWFISFHRNSSPQPNQYSGVESLVYDLSGRKVDMAENINGALGELGFKNLGVRARPGLVVLRRTQMPAVLVEVGFINNDADNALFDEKFDEIARASPTRSWEHWRRKRWRSRLQGSPCFTGYRWACSEKNNTPITCSMNCRTRDFRHTF